MYRIILVSTFTGLLLIVLATAAVAWVGALTTRYEFDRSQLAHAVLQGHLSLETEAYLVLNRLTESLVSTGVGTLDVAAARVRLNGKIEAIRRGILTETWFVGASEDEAGELNRLTQMERLIGRVLDQVETAEAAMRGAAPRDASQLRAALSPLIGQEFRDLVVEAVNEEHAEVQQVQETAIASLQRLAALSKVAAVSAVVLCAGALVVLIRRISAPLEDLMLAMRAVAGGNLAHRVPVRGRDEFAKVAQQVNTMVQELAESRKQAEYLREGLEDAIGQRTGELKEANQSLRQADETRRRFLADVSHELRTPLTVIRGEAEVTLRGRGLTPADYETALVRINEQAILTGRLVDDLLFVARVEAGEPRLRRQSVSLGDIARRAAASAEVVARRKEVSIECQSQAAEPVAGDPAKLTQMVMILLDNAIRYSRPRTEILVSVAPVAAGVALSVADQGIGIADSEVGRVFDRFYRGENAAAQHPDGSGLGLAMAKAIAEAHNGTVALDTHAGKGTTVTVMLPGQRRSAA